MSPKPDEYDLELTAQIVVDSAYLWGDIGRSVEFDTKRRLRREIEKKLPDGYTLEDCIYSQYETFQDERNFGMVTYRLRVYL